MTSELKSTTLEIRRKIKKTERALDRFIAEINEQSDEKLRKHIFTVGFEHEYEANISAYKAESTEARKNFVLEVDRNLEDQSQARASRFFHKKQIIKLLPKWVLSLDEGKYFYKYCYIIYVNIFHKYAPSVEDLRCDGS